MDTVKIIPVIETTLTRRGEGKAPESPIRTITQYWTTEGRLLAEVDIAAATLTPEMRDKIETAIIGTCGGSEAQNLINAIDKIIAST